MNFAFISTNMAKKRWQERLEFYNRAINQLKAATAKTEYSELERAGLIQIFEYTFELGWKLMRDYCTELGYETNSPRASIQNGVLAGLITEADGYEWIDALKQRNLLSHTYDEQRSLEAEALIKQRYYVIIERLWIRFQDIL